MASTNSSPLLGLDLGTSSVKTVLFDRSGRVLASASRDYPTLRPQPGWAEQDPAVWWEAAVATLREVLSAGAPPPVALGISSQSSALVPVTAEGQALGLAPLWLDRRAQPECDEIRSVVGEERILALSGNRLDPSYLLPKVLWLRAHQPERYAAAAHFLHAGGFLVHRLTGAASTDRTEGGMSLLYDMSTGAWSPELLSAFDLPAEKFPAMRSATEVVGQVTDAAAAATGLPPGLPVMAGSMDLLAAATGAAVAAEGQSFLVIGTATVLATCIPRPQPHADLQMHNHALPGLWVHAANVDFGGAAFGWLRGVLRGAGAELSYEELARLAEATFPERSTLLFLPYMVGQRAPLWDDDCRGVFFGLQPEHTAGHLIRAVLEGNALALGRLQALQEQVHGRPIEEIHVSGGQSALPLVNQMVADVTGRTVVVMDAPEVACRGAALLAGLGTGMYASAEELSGAVRVAQRFSPRPEWHEHYARLGEIMAEVYTASRPGLQRLWEEGKRP